MKNKVSAFIRPVFVVAFLTVLSCTMFDSSTNVGKDVIKDVDPSIVNLKGYKAIANLYLPVTGANSRVLAGADTSIYHVPSGVHTWQTSPFFATGTFANEKATAYAEFHVNASDMLSIRTACDSVIDSVYMLLYYYRGHNDTTIIHRGKSTSITVYSCARKCFPKDHNDALANNLIPIKTFTLPNDTADTIMIPLNNYMLPMLKSVIADTSFPIKILAKIDTVYGKSSLIGNNDTLFFKDTVLPDTIRKIIHIPYTDSVVMQTPVCRKDSTNHADTLIVMYKAFLKATGLQVDTSFFADTLIGKDTVVNFQAVTAFDTTLADYMNDSTHIDTTIDTQSVVTYTAKRFDTLTAHFNYTYVYDSTKKFIGAVTVSSNGPGIAHFMQPIFRVKYLANCKDTTRRDMIAAYYDMYTKDDNNATVADSLVSSWATDRFVTMPVNLKPLWNSLLDSSTGKMYSIVQQAVCSLSIDRIQLENGLTSLVIPYGLLDKQVSARDGSSNLFDSLGRMINAGRIQTVRVIDSLDTIVTRTNAPKTIGLSVLPFIQSMINAKTYPATAYLYVGFSSLVSTSGKFARIRWTQDDSTTTPHQPKIRFYGLFTNQHN